MSNGTGIDGDGLYLRAKTPALMAFFICSFLGNEGNGIQIAYDTYGVLSLAGVSYFGNDTNMNCDLDYYAHPAPQSGRELSCNITFKQEFNRIWN
jgi:hypothetical protein